MIAGRGHAPRFRARALWMVIAPSEATANEIRLFVPDGTHLRTIGGHGEGPGEFSAGRLVAWVPPDTILAWHPSCAG